MAPPTFVSNVVTAAGDHCAHKNKNNVSFKPTPLLSRVANAIRRSPRPLQIPRRIPPPTLPPTPPTDADWLELIYEYENAAASTPNLSGSPSFTPAPDSVSRYSRGSDELFPLVHASCMAAVTAALWYFGRVLRLNSFLLLFYPLPTMYVAARSGLEYSNVSFITALFFILCLTGPWYLVIFICSSGLLALTYARCIWYRLSFTATLFAGAAALGTGIVLQVCLLNVITQENSWPVIVDTAFAFMSFISSFSARIPLLPTLPVPSSSHATAAVLILVAFHSLYQVFCTLVFSSLLLNKFAENEEMTCMPPEFPLVTFVLRRAREQRPPIYEDTE